MMTYGTCQCLVTIVIAVVSLAAQSACASKGLSLDTSYLVAMSYSPTGTVANLLPTATGNGWTVELWLTWQPSGPSRTHALFEQITPGCCSTLPSNNFQYSIDILATGVVRAKVKWYAGSLTLDSTVALTSGYAWTQLTVVFKQYDGIYMYLNGTLDNASLLSLLPSNPTLEAFTWNTTVPFLNNGTLNLFDESGLVDEIRFRQKALSSSDVKSDHCKRESGNSDSITMRYSFDSNLAPDGIDRDYLNTTFDMHTTAIPNDLFHSPDLPPAALPQEEPHFCASGAVPTDIIVIVSVVLGVCFLLLVLWVLVILLTHSGTRNAEDARVQATKPRTLGGTEARLRFAPTTLNNNNNNPTNSNMATMRRKARTSDDTSSSSSSL